MRDEAQFRSAVRKATEKVADELTIILSAIEEGMPEEARKAALRCAITNELLAVAAGPLHFHERTAVEP